MASFNIADSFRAYSFFDPKMTPLLVGVILALIFAVSIFGGSKQISRITGVLVPLMGIFYLAVALFIVVTHYQLIPGMFADIFSNAFDFQAIFGGFAGSCIMNGIKRGLFSNEAGVGSAPNAAASAAVSHPVKQGLVQMLSVFIDTILICSATAFMLLCSGTAPSVEQAGMPWVQAAASSSLGGFGTIFITIALCLFAFTTLIGNFYYAEMGLQFLCGRKPGKVLLNIFRIVAALVVLVGATMEFGLVWNMADVLMGPHGPHQPSGDPDPGRTCHPGHAGLYEAEKGRQGSGVQGCGYPAERQDRLLELIFIHFFHHAQAGCLRYREGKYNRPGFGVRSGLFHDGSHNRVFPRGFHHDKYHFFFFRKAKSRNRSACSAPVPLA